MGESAYRQMAEEYLLAEGKTQQQAREMISKGLQEMQRQENREKKYQPYLNKTLFKGLETVPANSKREHKLFRANEFKVVLQRCRKNKVAIRRMVHLSSDSKMQRVEEIHWILRNYIDGPKLFKKWQDEGCNDLFYAEYSCTPKALDGWNLFNFLRF